MLNSLKKKYDSIPLPARAAVWFTICNVLLKGISFFTTPLFTRLLPTDEYGLLSIYVSYEQLILIFATWELSLGTYQKGLFKYKNDASILTSSLLVFSNILTFCLFALITLFWKPFRNFTGFTRQILLVLFLYLLVQPAYSCWTVRKRIIYDYKSTVTATLVFSLLAIFVPLSAVLLLNRTAQTKFVFGLIPAVIGYGLFYIRSLKIKELVKNRAKVKEMWHFFLLLTPPLVIHSLSYLVLGQADRVMIGKMVNNSSAGIYSIAYAISNIASMFQSAITTVLVPWTYSNLEEKSYSNLRKKTTSLVLLMAAVYLSFILVLPDVIKLLFPPQYYEAVWCIPPIAIGAFFMFLYSLFVNIETYLEKTKYIAIVSVSCALLNIVLNYFGIKILGYIACAYTTLICYILFALGHGLVMWRLSKKMLNNERVYNLGLIFIMCCSVVVFMILITLLYPYSIVRYSLVGAILLISFVFRNKIIGIVNGLRKQK